MASTTNLPSLAVGDIIGPVAETLRTLASTVRDLDGDLKEEFATQEVLLGLSRRIESYGSALKSELRQATELLAQYGVELPDFPRFEA